MEADFWRTTQNSPCFAFGDGHHDSSFWANSECIRAINHRYISCTHQHQPPRVGSPRSCPHAPHHHHGCRAKCQLSPIRFSFHCLCSKKAPIIGGSNFLWWVSYDCHTRWLKFVVSTRRLHPYSQHHHHRRRDFDFDFDLLFLWSRHFGDGWDIKSVHLLIIFVSYIILIPS